MVRLTNIYVHTRARHCTAVRNINVLDKTHLCCVDNGPIITGRAPLARGRQGYLKEYCDESSAKALPVSCAPRPAPTRRDGPSQSSQLTDELA